MQIPKYYEDLSVFDVNTEESRAYYIPFSPEEDFNWEDRRDTDRFFLLNGDWKFRYFASIYECTENFFAPDYDAHAYDTVPVPSNWQMTGYDQAQYTNTRYPFPFDPPYVPHDNPCGAYIKEFIYEKAEDKRTYHLNFEGVDSCFYVWLNGAFVGYHQVSHAMAEYDITAYLQQGRNVLAVLVLKWCDGSYLEDQDKFRSSGIFRDVYILARPEGYIRDYFVKMSFEDDYQKAYLTIDIESYHLDEEISYILYDACGKEVISGKSHGKVGISGKSDQTRGRQIQFAIEQPILWNAEQPYLYTLYLSTSDEVIREHIGLREIYTKDSVVYLNGKKLRFRGINRHDSDPYVGSAVNREHIYKDLLIMKRHNFNAIRTSHYPNAPEFYEMCDKYGFYVIDEADMEAHGVVDLYNVNIFEEGGEHPFPPFISDNRDWIPAITDRVQKLVIRDKNRSCVLIWSMGNESGYGVTFEAALAWTKEYDSSRLTHYEGSLHRPRNPQNGFNDYSNIDLRSRMYASIPEMHAYLQNDPDKPFIQCEYIHAMGNGPGDVEDYYKLEEMYDSYVGGFVWEWCDHGIYIGDTPDGKPKFLYGGESGEYPHDGSFCMDGIVKPDRGVTTGLLEYKNVHRPLRIYKEEWDNTDYILQNNLDFTNLKDYLYLTYSVECDGNIMVSGKIDDPEILDLEARQKKKVILPIAIPAYEGKITVIIRSLLKYGDALRQEGMQLGFDQIMVSDRMTRQCAQLLNEEKENHIQSSPANVQKPSVYGRHTEHPIDVAEDERSIVIQGSHFRYTFDKRKGLFESLIYDDRCLIEKPMELNVWRAPTDNDRVVRRLWEEAGYDRLTTRAYYNEVSDGADGCVQIATVSSMAAVYRQRVLDFSIIWKIYPDGRIVADFTVEKDSVMRKEYALYFNQPVETYDRHGIRNMFEVNETFLPRLGIRLFLPKEMDTVHFFGYGPYESYIDKRQASWLGYFEATVSSMYEDYVKPQEHGSHYGCEYVSVQDRRSKLTVYSENPLSFNASEYTQEELTTKKHNFELEKSGYTVLCIDYRQSGIGSGSCGPQLSDEYRLNQNEYHFSIHMKPEIISG